MNFPKISKFVEFPSRKINDRLSNQREAQGKREGGGEGSEMAMGFDSVFPTTTKVVSPPAPYSLALFSLFPPLIFFREAALCPSPRAKRENPCPPKSIAIVARFDEVSSPPTCQNEDRLRLGLVRYHEMECGGRTRLGSRGKEVKLMPMGRETEIFSINFVFLIWRNRVRILRPACPSCPRCRSWWRGRAAACQSPAAGARRRTGPGWPQAGTGRTTLRRRSGR